jgi:predicted nucleic acid-binding protein
MRSILIDSDVILDFLFDRSPFNEHAGELLSLCESGTFEGYVTPVIISNLYYILRRTAPHEKVINSISKLVFFMDVLLTDKEVVLSALHSDFKDFEDALQYFSAAKNGNIEVIVTRNTKDYKKSAIGVMTPEQVLLLYQS